MIRRDPPDGARTFEALGPTDALDSLADSDLSDWFGPFLPQFARETLRCGGQVLTSRTAGVLQAVYLHRPTEGLDSVFTRDDSLARRTWTAPAPPSLYTPFPRSPSDEVFRVYDRRLTGSSEVPELRHAPRLARPRDGPTIRAFLTDLYGAVDDAWFATPPTDGEQGFLVESGGSLVGVAWATLARRHARFHSLSVRPRFRRLGIGRDLWWARALWASSAGADHALSEVGERNVASCALAEQVGMREVGRIYRHDRSDGP